MTLGWLEIPAGTSNAKPIVYQVTKTGCWECISHPSERGYPVITRLKKYKMSRYLWSLQKGPIPDGLCVCHRCDNPKCINIDHLFLGTSAENTQDKVRKGRQAKEGAVNTAKLTRDEVIQILREITNGVPLVELARRYKVTLGAISCIKRGKSWKSIARD